MRLHEMSANSNSSRARPVQNLIETFPAQSCATPDSTRASIAGQR